MQTLTTLILIIVLSQNCLSQSVDTIRVYDYLKVEEKWKLKVKNNKSFALYTNNQFSKDDITSSGVCIAGASTIQFICDTSKIKLKYLTTEVFKKFSNIPFILCGNIFPKQNNFLIPRNLNYAPNDSLKVPKGIYARYYRGDGFGSNIIELKQDGTYIFSDNSCTAQFKEEGTWTLNNEILTFLPKEGDWSMLEWVTKDRKLYLTENHLVGKKIAKTITKAKKIIVTETFIYLSKMPKYPNE